MDLAPSPHAAKELIHFRCTPTKVANVLLQADSRFIFTALNIFISMVKFGSPSASKDCKLQNFWWKLMDRRPKTTHAEK